MKRMFFPILFLAIISALSGCSVETPPEPTPSETPPTVISSEEPTAQKSGKSLLENAVSLFNEDIAYTITLNQGDVHQSYEGSSYDYWTRPNIRLSEWREISDEEWNEISKNAEGEIYSVSIAWNDGSAEYSLITAEQGELNYAVFTCENEEYRFVGELSPGLFRSIYDWVEYFSLAQMSANFENIIPNVGQDALSAAEEAYSRQEEARLDVSPGSSKRFSFVKCHVGIAEYETEAFRKTDQIDQNTWAIYASTIFVPDNELAYNESIAGNTEEYNGDDPDVPEGAWYYKRVGYVTLSDDVWIVNICGTGW